MTWLKNDGMSMAEYVLVNGARMEKTFFDENVAEAKGCVWRPATVCEKIGHQHCMVCMNAIAVGEDARNADYRWICCYCYEHYINSGPQEPNRTPHDK
jgi:hypothetical protein